MPKSKIALYVTLAFIVVGSGLYFLPAREVLKKDAVEQGIQPRELVSITSRAESNAETSSVQLSEDLSFTAERTGDDGYEISTTILQSEYDDIESYINQNRTLYLDQEVLSDDSELPKLYLVIESELSDGTIVKNTITCQEKCPSESVQVFQWLDDIVIRASRE